MASSDSLSPTAVIGGACSQPSECGEAEARSLALSTSDGALERTSSSDLAYSASLTKGGVHVVTL